jgi:ATP-dependent Clp protease ATP-binding subunit ClpB
MTSNLGASEMSALMSPRLGFNCVPESHDDLCRTDEKLNAKVARTGVDAARRKFTPEFMNRLDKVVVFRPLGEDQLRKILDIELNMVQQRIFNSSPDRAFIFHVTEAGKTHLLREGIDIKYGARHLKRAIERLLVQPLSNLIATDQIRTGDWIRVDLNSDVGELIFLKEAEGLPIHTMAELVDNSITMPVHTLANGAIFEPTRTSSARSSRRG